MIVVFFVGVLRGTNPPKMKARLRSYSKPHQEACLAYGKNQMQNTKTQENLSHASPRRKVFAGLKLQIN